MDKGANRVAARERKRRQRAKSVTSERDTVTSKRDILESVTSPPKAEGVTPGESVTFSDVTPLSPVVSLPPEWDTIARYISREGSGMPNLERLQRIAGSLGKYADEVWMGELTVGDIGRVIGKEGPKY
tara:strand:+ start:227 stop:610 length:384 start_codon:yes stop_codon:yes gene_type:complete